jgi:hypothetical protein
LYISGRKRLDLSRMEGVLYHLVQFVLIVILISFFIYLFNKLIRSEILYIIFFAFLFVIHSKKIVREKIPIDV